jgi:hypothetical protein
MGKGHHLIYILYVDINMIRLSEAMEAYLVRGSHKKNTFFAMLIIYFTMCPLYLKSDSGVVVEPSTGHLL